MGRRTRIEAPKPSAEEIALRRKHLEILIKQEKEAEALKPFTLAQLGLVEEAGKIRKMTEDEYVATLTSIERMFYENLKISLERQRKALLGEIPISEATKQRKEQEYKLLKEQLARAGHVIEDDGRGVDYAVGLSTPAAQALGEFKKKWGLLEEAERHGELGAGTARTSQMLGDVAGQRETMRTGLLQTPMRYTPLMAGYEPLIQAHERQRDREFQARLLEQQLKSQERSALFGALGNIFSTVGGIALYKWLGPKLI